ncbi:hypothetical protein A0256_12455 [Mucilaginibacter sp. PAMC 26640]|nr:hypothetical protein A0256_12455 [Mucilaginibacter sp. PAMC 26640]
MTFVKCRLLLVVWLCNCICFVAYGQKPVIIPKQDPVLPLNSQGFYKIVPQDVATYLNNTDSPTVVKVIPEAVDCSTLGKQQLQIKALTNGGETGPPPQFNVGFPGAISGLAYDLKGNLYVIELRSYSVRKITPEGDVTILAGAGERGGSDGPGDKARFGTLFGIVCDDAGNVYVSDQDNHSIRKITPDGMVSTFAGTGFEGAVNGTGNKASFGSPYGLDIDAAGNIYVADFGNKMIRKITPAAVVSTIAATAVYTYDVAAGPDGYIYWGSQSGSTSDHYVAGIYRIKEGGSVELYAGASEYMPIDGPRLQARFVGVFGLHFGAGGNLFATDYNSIRRISPDGVVSTFVQSIKNPAFLAVDLCGNLAVANEETITRLTMGAQTSIIASGNFPKLTGKVQASICQFAEATIPVTVQSKPALPDMADKNVSGCAALADYTLNLSATDNCPGTSITYRQSPAAGTPFSGAATLDVTITATDATGGTDSKTFKVTNTGLASGNPTVSVEAANNPICSGEPANFHATVANAGSGLVYQWQVNGINAGANSPDFASITLVDGDWVNCLVTTANDCGVPNGAGGVTVTIKPKPVVTVSTTEQIVAGSSVVLKPTVTGDVISYLWEPATGLDDAASQFPVASPATTTTYKLTVFSAEGCNEHAGVTVTVVNDLVIPNTFTPNADGVNDLWIIQHLNALSNCTVQVYNRHGNIVYNSIGYALAWNGTLNGKALPAGVYYYLIDLKDGSGPLSGSVTIIR